MTAAFRVCPASPHHHIHVTCHKSGRVFDPHQNYRGKPIISPWFSQIPKSRLTITQSPFPHNNSRNGQDIVRTSPLFSSDPELPHFYYLQSEFEPGRGEDIWFCGRAVGGSWESSGELPGFVSWEIANLDLLLRLPPLARRNCGESGHFCESSRELVC